MKITKLERASDAHERRQHVGTMADIDEMMCSCGLEILHPGGMEKTDEMARMCKIGSNKVVLDIGSGKGATACYLAEDYGCDVVGVDTSERMIAYAREMAEKRGLDERVRFRRADAHELPFADAAFDIVVTECTTVLLDKEKAFSEFIRVTKPGGYIGDLEMTWQEPPTKEMADTVHDVWEGFRTMTLEEWKEFYEKMGLFQVETVDFSEMIPDMEEAVKKALGFKGTVKMGCKLLLRPRLRKAMSQYSTIFKECAEYIGCGYTVGRTERRGR